MRPAFLGLDVGSTTVKAAIVDSTGRLHAHRYQRSNGRPRQAVLAVLAELAAQISLEDIAGMALTGSGGGPVAQVMGCTHINELVAQTRAVGACYPQARTVIEIGGQDSKFLSVAWDNATRRMVLVDFAMNSLCAAGTGSFLDQQAERLGIRIEDEFAALALQSTSPARIAGRCTVFAKSDMIHLQQKGTPLPDILAGLCLALARNFKSVVARGKQFAPPVLFQGGVAYNQAVRWAFETLLGCAPGELIVPEHHEVMAALGAALIAADEAGSRPAQELDLERLAADLAGNVAERKHLPPLRASTPEAHHAPAGEEAVALPVYLGIDVGSISTNVVLIDTAGQVLARRYLPTAGQPLEAVRRGLTEIGAEAGGRYEVLGVGVTGSGRYLTGDFVGADLVRNEITAQARAAIAIDPQVETIFEIGGQDSKFISLRHGTIVDFAMNNACAAGTGSFLEEQADRLNISVREEFSQLAFGTPQPACLGERCTVFMESDIVHHQQQGARLDELTAGLAYAVAQNYLNRVANGRPVGQRVFFQGGVAANRAVVAAFTQLLGRTVTVPPHHDVTGAIGAALLAQEALAERRRQGEAAPTRFRGFDLAGRHYQASTFECRACPNLCDVSKVVIAGEAPIFYGALCDRFEEAGRSRGQPASRLPDLFAERNRLMLGEYAPPGGPRAGRRRVAMPRVLTFYDMFPYWHAFFTALDIDLILSEPTNPATTRRAQEQATAETCFPAKLVYAHVAALQESDADLIFLPAVIDRENAGPGQAENNYCPYVPAMSYLVQAQQQLHGGRLPILATPIRLLDPAFKRRDLAALAAQLGVPGAAVRAADQAGAAAQRGFYAAVRQRGQEVLANLPDGQPAAVIVGRPYNTYDTAVCQDLPYKLRRLGVLPIPLDYLPLQSVDITGRHGQMYWRAGQDILAAAAIIRDDPRLQAIYLTNFSCGPDSFILSFFQRAMGDKPFLELEIDDHTADAGIITRCEAFFDSLAMARTRAAPVAPAPQACGSAT